MRCCHLALPRLLIHAAGLCATETPAKCKICLKILIVGMRAQNGPKTASSGCKKKEKEQLRSLVTGCSVPITSSRVKNVF